MQLVAREMNQSETAFLRQRDDRSFDLRWFSPTTEVDLCGHATLASAHVLWTSGMLRPDEHAHFHTRSGLLKARRVGEEIELDFPATPAAPAEAPQGMLEALDVQAARVGVSRFDYLVQVESESIVRSLTPNFNQLAQVKARGIIVTAPSSTPHFDFISRFFAPASGINEDPVTGSAHCVLAPWWREQLGRADLRAYQASARGGSLRVRVAGDRVRLIGRAVSVWTITLPDALLP